jgi:hypothetical protein
MIHHTFWCLNRSSIGTEGIITGGNWDGIDQTKVDFLKPSMWRDSSNRYVGLDHQVILAFHKPDCANTHTNVTLVYGGTLQTPDPTPAPTPVPTSYYHGQMKVLYKCGDPNPSTSQIKPQFNIVNNGNETIRISDLTVHYYYTKTGVVQEVFNADYAPMGTSNISGTFHDGYVEISFGSGAGNLSPGSGETGEIQLRINRTSHDEYDQTDDYSFDASKTSYAEWDHILLLLAGELVWGIPPGGLVPDATPEPTSPSTPDPTVIITQPPGVDPTPTQTTLPSQMRGDVNMDNKIDIVDALLIAQYYVGLDPDNFKDPVAADVNNDGKINIVDALLVAQYYVGMIGGF